MLIIPLPPNRSVQTAGAFVSKEVIDLCGWTDWETVQQRSAS
jgi:hypothetical protein